MDILLSCFLHDPALESRVYIPRFTHRLSLTKEWVIEPGRRILDIGCGQGESCLALALDVGDSGHITGIDVAPLDYGTPFTVKESREYVIKSVLGPRIDFFQTDAASLLQPLDGSPSPAYDAAALCHSLWYFSTRESVFSLFETLAAARISRVYLAEYSFQASDCSQVPHVLAAQAQALFHAYKTPREPGINELNIRAALDQASILEAAKSNGFEVHRQGIITPEENLLEGHFEARHVQGDLFRNRVIDEKLPVEQEAEILALGLRVKKEMEKLNERGIPTVRAMDVWWAVLELNA
jgi:SAM-dependent methyltransferase